MTAASQWLDGAVGESIPPVTPHAVSVSLPTWKANVAYEEGEEWVITKMETGYPRFFIHRSIQKFAEAILEKYGTSDQKAMLFPSFLIAQSFWDFYSKKVPSADQSFQIIELVPSISDSSSSDHSVGVSSICACIFPSKFFSVAKEYWQHAGNGVSSRRAEYFYTLFENGLLVKRSTPQADDSSTRRGPRRYQRMAINGSETQQYAKGVSSTEAEAPESYIEERFGRNLNISLASSAKVAIRRRIAGNLTADVELKHALQIDPNQETPKRRKGISEDDVYLYPTGMNAIFNTHQCLLQARGQLKSVCYGFPYIDTLKMLEKFGPGCVFYGFCSASELDDLEDRLKGGERILGLFCEFPGNPLLISPDLARIRSLADKYDFAVVVDESIGNFLNVNVLPYADVVVSSLTKLFSGDSNVMGGSAVLNPKGRFYPLLKQTWDQQYVDNYWIEDAIVMERNSRDFVSRSDRINHNAEAICDLLVSHPKVKCLYYPKHSPSKELFDRCRTDGGGYGGLLSATFHSKADAVKFFDSLRTCKGPSLGTNFTLSSPYVILAHYNELPWVASLGVEPDLVRVSVGLEDTNQLVEAFKDALASIDR